MEIKWIKQGGGVLTYSLLRELVYTVGKRRMLCCQKRLIEWKTGCFEQNVDGMCFFNLTYLSLSRILNM